MPFLTQEKHLIDSSGPLDAKLAFIGEAPGLQEERQGKPFVGQAGTILQQCMHSAQLIRAECYLTNVVKVKPEGNNIKPFFNGKQFTEDGHYWIGRLRAELQDHPANLLVAVGKTAFAALCPQLPWNTREGVSIKKRRGYIHESELLPGRKVLPIIHPSATFKRVAKDESIDESSQNPYLLRYYITRDLRKARVESQTPEFNYPERQLCIPTNFQDALAAIGSLHGKSPLSCDIEVANDEVSCIGFCHDRLHPVTIPFYKAWTEQEEISIWQVIADLLEDTTTIKIFQNAAFDIPFLFQQNRILTRGPIEDTMIAHSVTYPEFPKSLEFLGSIYSNQPYWKDLAKAGGSKRDA